MQLPVAILQGSVLLQVVLSARSFIYGTGEAAAVHPADAWTSEAWTPAVWKETCPDWSIVPVIDPAPSDPTKVFTRLPWQQWSVDNECSAVTITYSHIDKTVEQIAAERTESLVALGRTLEEAMEGYIERVARSRRYRSTDRLLSYLNSTNTVWKDEAQRFSTWRDTVVGQAIALEAAVASGARDPLTWEQLLEELDDPPWPISV